MLDERRLVRQLKKDDRQAFAELLDRYESRVYRLAVRYVRTSADAEDLVQEVFLAIHKSIAGFQERSTLSTWIYRIALNHCLEYQRRRKTVTVPLEDTTAMASTGSRDDPVQMATRGELSEQVGAAIEHLSDLHRQVILLHEMHGLTYQECADILDVPVGTVKSRLSNAFAQLREILGSYVCEDL